MARHTVGLSPAELFEVMDRMLTREGTAWLSFPTIDQSAWLANLEPFGLHVTNSITVRDYPGAKPHMTIVGLARNKPQDINKADITYRVARLGSLSPWMFQFRERWYPAHYNAQFYKT